MGDENNEVSGKHEAPLKAMTREEADKTRLLLAEDKAKYALEIARHEAAIGNLRMYIMECDVALADVTRREAGVEYPEPSNPAPSVTDPEAK